MLDLRPPNSRFLHGGLKSLPPPPPLSKIKMIGVIVLPFRCEILWIGTASGAKILLGHWYIAVPFRVQSWTKCNKNYLSVNWFCTSWGMRMNCSHTNKNLVPFGKKVPQLPPPTIFIRVPPPSKEKSYTGSWQRS